MLDWFGLLTGHPSRAGFTTSAIDYLSILFNLHEVKKNRRELTIAQKMHNHNLDLTYCPQDVFVGESFSMGCGMNSGV